MRKKVSKNVSLVLITSVLASCSQPQNKIDPNQQKVYMRADTTAPYTEVTQNYHQQRHAGSGMSPLLWYMAFRHLGGGMGYANQGLHPNSVSGTNANKARAYSTQRGGFGKTGHTSSSRSMGA